MYQGKFDSAARGQQDPGQTLEKILKEREAAIAAKEARAAQRAAAKRGAAGETMPTRTAAPAQKPAAPAQKPAAPAQKPAAPVQKSAAAAQKPAAAAAQKPAAAAQKAAAASRKSAEQASEEPVRRGPRLGGIIFYTIYFVCIFAFFIGIFGVLTWLNGWLKDYEAAQPTVKCQEVFEQLFRNPDWAQLYRLSGMEDTEFEGVDQYVAYMQNKVGSQELNFVETSAGLSSGKKYAVRLGREKIATFTLDGKTERLTDIPDWQLGKIELFVNRTESLTIRKLENHVVYVNGVPLDDSYTIQIASTVADQYLPVGTSGVRTSIQCIEGLLTVPSLVVYDELGANQISVVYNPDSGMYEEQTSAIAMTDEERTAVFGALESYAGFMINASGARTNLTKYFDGTSQAYKDIIGMAGELWMNSDKGHRFEKEEILGYTKYSDSLFSVRATVTMHTNITNISGTEGGGEKDYVVTLSMFFTKKNGSWVCYETYNFDITQPVGKVRLTFLDNTGAVISTDFYETSLTELTCPTVTAPAGKVFSGWCRVTTDETGNTTWTVVFTPDETGHVNLTGTSLTPMTLRPLFE